MEHLCSINGQPCQPDKTLGCCRAPFGSLQPDQIKGLNLRDFKLLHKQAYKPRTYILVNNKVKASLILNLSSADLTIIRVTLYDGKNIIVASGYLPYEVTDPGRDLTMLFNYCKNEKLELILVMDANAHHTIWGSSNINQREEVIMDLLLTTDLSILNRGSEPTFVIRIRQEVIDLTVCSKGLLQKIKGWKVSSEPSLCDHRHLRFTFEINKVETEYYRNPKRTNWDNYRADLSRDLNILQFRLGSRQSTERAVNMLQDSIVSAYKENCPFIERKGTGQCVAWWNANLSKLRKSSRKLLNKAMKSGLEQHCESYKDA
ncbi:uncharacterized protein LOC126902021 [Daktulosphaira vitifoliae]|uniref:uncharacterized protein LOC126902021 n=1 Tax=Daktulosphaira vitifoliae TaxID=58002 RepID=UPI0021AAF911|nr:uncharacterized protein LOC126902021 [Daktulosphaira vitifoliae]